jgi:hypothetical protein
MPLPIAHELIALIVNQREGDLAAVDLGQVLLGKRKAKRKGKRKEKGNPCLACRDHARRARYK